MLMAQPNSSSVRIHGDEWQLAHLQQEIDWCRAQSGWTHQTWKRRPALVDRHRSTPYVGQEFDPAQVEIDPVGWDHDHCRICTWTLMESLDPALGEGFVLSDGTGCQWVCCECHEQFLRAAAEG